MKRRRRNLEREIDSFSLEEMKAHADGKPAPEAGGRRPHYGSEKPDIKIQSNTTLTNTPLTKIRLKKIRFSAPSFFSFLFLQGVPRQEQHRESTYFLN